VPRFAFRRNSRCSSCIRPFWQGKDDGAWSIAKGEYDPDEEHPLEVAQREFTEEVGLPPPIGEFLDLGEHRLPSRKLLQCYAIETDLDLRFVSSNTFSLEWPPRSGLLVDFPECDDAQWFEPALAGQKLTAGQRPLMQLLRQRARA